MKLTSPVILHNVPFNTDAVETVARQLRDVTSGLQLIRKGNFFDFINFSNTINPGLVIVEGTQFPSANERDRLENLGKRKDLFVVYLAYKKGFGFYYPESFIFFYRRRKMKFKKTAIITALALSASIPVLASADIKTDTIDEVWGKPTLVYGAGLTDSEVSQTNRAFGITNIENVNRQVNSGQDFSLYLGQPGVSDNSLFSSVLVQKQASGKGVNVDIKTPQNITQVTSTQYANAAITAGASDVNIDVASVKKVTGCL